MALGLLLVMFLFYNGLKSDVTRSAEPMALGLLLSDVSFLQRIEIRCFKIGRAYGSFVEELLHERRLLDNW